MTARGTTLLKGKHITKQNIYIDTKSIYTSTLMGLGKEPDWYDSVLNVGRKFYSVFSTVFLMCLSCCLLLVLGPCCLFLVMKMFYC